MSINEWIILIEALDKDCANSSLLGFYNLCRSVLIIHESDYDKFDAVFAEYFYGIEIPEDLPKEFWEWLNKDTRTRDEFEEKTHNEIKMELEELLKMFEERKKEQKEKHDGGNYWIGTGGTSKMGHGGYNNQGIRVGGIGKHMSAVQIAGERHFKDFREDDVLDLRQFQMAFRKLKQYSSRVDTDKTELDIDNTIKETSNNGGNLKIVFDKPRKNTIKLLLLIDSDGSMLRFSRLCNTLFQAVNKSSHFKDLKVYYFHNCIYDKLYTTPYCKKGDWIDTKWILNNLDSEYKVIFVGDASMAPSELFRKGGNSVIGLYNEEIGMEWLAKFERKYKKKIWLNPIIEEHWERAYGAYTISEIRKIFDMYPLTLQGLDNGIKKLLVR